MDMLMTNLQGVIAAAPVVAVLIYAYYSEKHEKTVALASQARAEARLRGVLRHIADLPAEEAENGGY